MKFGVFDHVERRDDDIALLFEQRLQFAEALDEAGFYAMHIAEHHMTKLGMAPSPNVYLAAVAQRTKRMKLGSMVYLLPMYEPIRLIEEIGMLDQISNGRLQIGLGRGISPFELGYFGITPQDSKVQYREMVDILLQGLTEGRLNYESKHYSIFDAPIEVPPKQKPYPPLWVGAHHTDSLDYAAKYGCNVVIGGPNAAVKRAVDYVPQAWEKFSDSPVRQNSPVSNPLIGGWRFPIVAETEKEAEEIAKSALEHHMDNLVSLWRAWGAVPNVYYKDWESAKASQVYVAGTPEMIRDRLASDIEETGINYMLFSLCWGNLTHEQTMRSFELLRDEVMPHFVDEDLKVDAAE